MWEKGGEWQNSRGFPEGRGDRTLCPRNIGVISILVGLMTQFPGLIFIGGECARHRESGDFKEVIISSR